MNPSAAAVSSLLGDPARQILGACSRCTDDLVCWACVARLCLRTHEAGIDQGLDLSLDALGAAVGVPKDVIRKAVRLAGGLVKKVERRDGHAVLTTEAGAEWWLDEEAVRLADLALGVAP